MPSLGFPAVVLVSSYLGTHLPQATCNSAYAVAYADPDADAALRLELQLETRD